MTKEDGLAEINGAEWIKDTYGCLNLYVHTANQLPVHCWLQLRPQYCDRGHLQLNVSLPGAWGGEEIDAADSFPRYFFSFEEADHHCRTFLKWRLWKERTYPHTLEKTG